MNIVLTGAAFYHKVGCISHISGNIVLLISIPYSDEGRSCRFSFFLDKGVLKLRHTSDFFLVPV